MLTKDQSVWHQRCQSNQQPTETTPDIRSFNFLPRIHGIMCSPIYTIRRRWVVEHMIRKRIGMCALAIMSLLSCKYVKQGLYRTNNGVYTPEDVIRAVVHQYRPFSSCSVASLLVYLLPPSLSSASFSVLAFQSTSM